MIPEVTDLIEKYVLGELCGTQLSEMQKMIKESPEIAFEVKLMQEISVAIAEQDVIDLRSNLKEIIDSEVNESKEEIKFNLADHFSSTTTAKNFTSQVSTTESSLQHIHIENHSKSLTGRIHQIPIASNQINQSFFSNQLSDSSIWEDIKEAILEKDIFELRNNLKDIISQGYINLSDFEIDQFLSNELSEERTTEIDSMIFSNKMVADQIKLHQEIDNAISENDIIEIKNNLSQIIEEEQQIKISEIKRIDDYLLNYLDEKEYAELESIINEDNIFRREVELNAEINAAITEAEVMNLRNSLSEIISENKESNKIRRFIPDNVKGSPLKYVGVAASAAAIISAGLFTLTQQKVNSEALFNQVYKPYEASGLFRSATVSNPAFLGIDLYNNQRYDDALSQFSKVLNENKDNPMCNFYAGLCYMGKNQYSDAIKFFQYVITEKDNLFIEQAEWYMALSLLKTSDEQKAYAILNRIIDEKSYYKKNAKELLRKLK